MTSITALTQIANGQAKRPENIKPLLPSAEPKSVVKNPIEEYTRFTALLLQLAKSNSDGSRPAAMILLGCNNSPDVLFTINDLCLLDKAYMEAAVRIIRARVELRITPDRLFKNGTALFNQLAQKWIN